METAEKKKKGPFSQLRKRFEEFFACGVQILRRSGSVIHDPFVALVESKRFAGETPFFFRSEEDCRGIAENAIFAPRPVEQFFEMLERVGALEPGIKHPVWENKIRRAASGERAPDSKTAVLPEAVHDDRVVVRTPLFYPIGKPGRVPVAPPPRPERMDWNSRVAHPRIVRRIERNNFHLVPATSQRRG